MGVVPSGLVVVVVVVVGVVAIVATVMAVAAVAAAVAVVVVVVVVTAVVQLRTACVLTSRRRHPHSGLGCGPCSGEGCEGVCAVDRCECQVHALAV